METQPKVGSLQKTGSYSSSLSKGGTEGSGNIDENVCAVCKKETSSMDYCENAGCDIYLCSSCYITTANDDIICSDCAGNCFSCDDIINPTDSESNTDILCSKCQSEGTFCEKCTDLFHLNSCNLSRCQLCVDKCDSCNKVLCCLKTFHTTNTCEMCVFFQLLESRDYMIKDLLKTHTKYYTEMINLIYDFVE